MVEKREYVRSSGQKIPVKIEKKVGEINEIEKMYDLKNTDFELITYEALDSDYWTFIWENKIEKNLYN